MKDKITHHSNVIYEGTCVVLPTLEKPPEIQQRDGWNTIPTVRSPNHQSISREMTIIVFSGVLLLVLHLFQGKGKHW